MDDGILFIEQVDEQVTDKPHCGDCGQPASLTDKPHCGDCHDAPVFLTDKPHCSDCGQP